MFSKYQLKDANFYISIGTVKKLVPNPFDKERYVLYYENLPIYIKLGLKLKNTLCTRIHLIVIAKIMCEI